MNEGDVLAGKYRVERILGRGGMGVVVAAIHVQLGQRVALKLLRPELLEHPAASLRFMREARAAAQIQSEHVVRVMDVGALDTGVPYMVMEFLQGSDLAAVLKARGPLGIDEAVEYVLQASQAVAEAHALGIVHRDLKPANLFLTRRGNGTPLVKVLDFGISKASFEYLGDGLGASMTMTHAFMGSPLYMAPEQLRDSKDVDGRADIWSLGVVLYELLSGSTPYYSETPWDLIASIIAEPPPAISSRRPDVPAAVDAVLVKCLQRERDQRYQTLEEFTVALMRSLRPTPGALDDRSPLSLSSQARLAAVPPSPGPAPSMQSSTPPALTASAWSKPLRSANRRVRALIVAGASAVVLLGAGLWASWAFSPRASDGVDAGKSAASVELAAPRLERVSPEPEFKPVAPSEPVRVVPEAPAVVAAPSASVTASAGAPSVAAATPKQAPLPSRPSTATPTRAGASQSRSAATTAPTARAAATSTAGSTSSSLDKFLSRRKPTGKQ
ncbi:MAG: protein kinase domain-containing protein [Myxococcota bacterium]